MNILPPTVKKMLNDLSSIMFTPSTILLGLLYAGVVTSFVPDKNSLSMLGLGFKFLLFYIYLQPFVWLVAYSREYKYELEKIGQGGIVRFCFCISFFQYVLWVIAGWVIEVENLLWPVALVISGLFLIYCTILLFKAGKAAWVFWAFSIIASLSLGYYASEWEEGIFEIGYNPKTLSRVIPIFLIYIAAYFTYKEVGKSNRFD